MIPLWVYIGLGAQLLWVLGSIIDKSLLEKYFPERLDGSAGVLVAISGCFSALVALCIGTFFLNNILLSPMVTSLGLLAGALNGLWLHLYLVATHQAEISRTIPVFQSIPIFGIVFAYFILGEKLGLTEVTAIILVLTGAFVLSYNWLDKTWLLKPVILMLVASAIIALQETIFKLVSESSTYWTAALLLTSGVALYAGILLIFNRKTRRLFMDTFSPNTRLVWGISIVNEILDNSAYLLFVFAITLGPVALVQSINAFQPFILLIAVTLITLFFSNDLKEDISYQSLTQKIIGITIITIGGYLLYTTIT